MKKNILITILILLLIIQSLLNYYFWKLTKTPEIHILEKPLRIASNFDNYVPSFQQEQFYMMIVIL